MGLPFYWSINHTQTLTFTLELIDFCMVKTSFFFLVFGTSLVKLLHHQLLITSNSTVNDQLDVFLFVLDKQADLQMEGHLYSPEKASHKVILKTVFFKYFLNHLQIHQYNFRNEFRYLIPHLWICHTIGLIWLWKFDF